MDNLSLENLTLEKISTLERLERHKKDWSNLAGETVEIKIYENDIYAFASELGCLRLYYKFRHCEVDKIRVAFSKPAGSWFFSLFK
jgi:hypothetical protein